MGIIDWGHVSSFFNALIIHCDCHKIYLDPTLLFFLDAVRPILRFDV